MFVPLRTARVGAFVLSVCVFAFLWQACGGGGSGSGGSSGNTGGGAAPGSRPTSTPRPPATPLGQVGTSTPVPTDTPTPDTASMLVVQGGEDIAVAAKNAPDGATVVVAPGVYGPIVLNPGDLKGSVTLFADVMGEFTDSPPAPVTIVAKSTSQAAVAAFGQNGLAIDGFTLRGGSTAAFLCSDCSGITVQDCTVSDSSGDGVRFEGSQDVLVFNNLLTKNKGAGVTALGTTNLQIVNNTIYKNRTDGVSLALDNNQNPSTDAYLRNNILNKNAPTGINVDPGPPSSLTGFDSDFNLNTDGYTGTAPGADDVNSDPLFIFPAGNDFHLAQESQAIDGGTDTIDSGLVDSLQQETTQTDGTLDTLPVDMGYHYQGAAPTPTPPPRATAVPTGHGTPARTSGVPGATPTSTRSGGSIATPTSGAKRPKTPKPTRTPRG